MHGRISGALRRTSKDDLHILQPVELDRVTDGSDPLSKSAERPDSPQGRRISTMHNSDPEVVLAAVAAVVAAYTRKPSAADEAALVRAVPALARRGRALVSAPPEERDSGARRAGDGRRRERGVVDLRVREARGLALVQELQGVGHGPARRRRRDQGREDAAHRVERAAVVRRRRPSSSSSNNPLLLRQDAVAPRDRQELPRLGRERVIQRRFNVGVPRARVPERTFTLRDRPKR